MKIRRKFLVIILLILTLSLFSACSSGGDEDNDQGTPTNNACGVLGLGTRIINGTSCNNPESAGVVRIIILGGGDSIGQCTGTMITPTKVLTAAHCFVGDSLNVGILIGADDSGDSFVPATRVVVHGNLFEVEERLANDVAIVTLERNPGLPTMPILDSDPVDAGNVVSIFGYGVDESGDVTPTIKSGEMKVTRVTDEHIIAFFDGETGSNTCQGDSGGPMVAIHNDVASIVGVTSSGTEVGCGAGDDSAFVNVQSDSVIDFIRSNAPGAEIF